MERNKAAGVSFNQRLFSFAIVMVMVMVIFRAAGAGAVVIEADADLHSVMGGLYAMSAAARLYYDDTHKTQCPSPEDLARYFKTPLPENWPADYGITVIRGEWWVGRKVPGFSAARKFLRDNAAALALYEEDGRSGWMGGSFVWTRAFAFENSKPAERQPELRAAQGEGGDGQYLFFNSPGTDYYWKSGFIYTTDAHAGALKKFPGGDEGSSVTFVTRQPLPKAREVISASPVEVPPDFSLGGGEEGEDAPSFGDVMINPFPRRAD